VKTLAKARLLALALPSALMLGALGSQYIGGLPPCEMCYWQRWPHEIAIVLALFAFAVRHEGRQRLLVIAAALAILASGAIGAFHAGVEYGWWQGLTQCSRPPGADGGDFIKNIMASPLIRCDQAPWSLFGISLAGYNAIISVMGALVIARMAVKRSA
jgi:disulfide bond formation protein DsbB